MKGKENERTMEQAKVSSEFCGGVLYFRLTGEIDHHCAPYIREQMDRDLYFFRPQRVILALDGIDFMDSSGLGLILGRYTKIRDMQGVLEIEDPTPQIEKILKLAGVNRLIPVKNSKAQQG
jgi:stage II sporulation protein AA (anti-sigma F factor antagonist)